MPSGSCSVAYRYSRPRGRSKLPSTCAEVTASRARRARSVVETGRESLVTLDGDFAGERRYRFLETVRQYSRERLLKAGAADRLRERHFEFFFNEFRGVLPILSHHGQLAVLQRLRIELENIREALASALTSPSLAEKGVELAGSMFWFWTKSGLFEEGKRWLTQALAVKAGASASVRARALIGLAHMCFFQGRQVEVGALAAEALSLGREDGDLWVVSFALFLQGDRALSAATTSWLRRDHGRRWTPPMQAARPCCVAATACPGSRRHIEGRL